MADDPLMRKRLAATVLYTAISGVWIYASYKEVSVLPTEAAAICVLVLGLAVGAYVRNWWMLLSLVGPLIALGYLEVSGFVGTSDDWAAEPLLSPPGAFTFIWLGVTMLLGRALREGADWLIGIWKRRGRSADSRH